MVFFSSDVSTDTIPFTLRESLKSALKSSTRFSSDLFDCSLDRLSLALFPMIFDRSIPVSSRSIILKVYTLSSLVITVEFISQMVSDLTDGQSLTWINELLSACIAFCIKSEESVRLLQCPTVFLSIQSVYHLFPYKSIFLLIRLINQDLFMHLNRKLFAAAVEQNTGIVRTNVYVLLAYFEGYKQRAMPVIRTEPMHDRVKKQNPFLESPIEKIILGLLSEKISPLVLPVIAFLAQSSEAAFDYFETSACFARIVRDEVAAAEKESKSYLRLNAFLEEMVPRSRKLKKVLAEMKYIDKTVKVIEKSIEDQVITVETVSSLRILKILARSTHIRGEFLSTYKAVNLLEKIGKIAYDHYKTQEYSEIVPFINEYFLLLGNLVIYDSTWKENALKKVFPKVLPYLSIGASRENVLKFLCSLSFEATSQICLEIFYKLTQEDIVNKLVSLLEKIQFVSILKNVLANSEWQESSSALIDTIIQQLEIVNSNSTSKDALSEEDTNSTISGYEQHTSNTLRLTCKLFTSILECIGNIAVVAVEQSVEVRIIQTAIDLFKCCRQRPVFVAFLSYLVNISHIPSAQKNKRNPSRYSSIPLALIAEIVNILRGELGKDAEIDFKINNLLKKIRND